MEVVVSGRKKNLKVGPWAEPYIAELLRGNYIHNPVIYLPDKVKKRWGMSYHHRWIGLIHQLEQAGLGVCQIKNNTSFYDEILILKKFFKKFLKERIVEQDKKSFICRIENRYILQYKCVRDGSFRVLPFGIKTLSDLLVEKRILGILDGEEDECFVEQRRMDEVLDKLDGKMSCPGAYNGDNDHNEYSGRVFRSKKGNIYPCMKHLIHFRDSYPEVRHLQRRKLINELKREARTRSY